MVGEDDAAGALMLRGTIPGWPGMYFAMKRASTRISPSTPPPGGKPAMTLIVLPAKTSSAACVACGGAIAKHKATMHSATI